MPSTKFNQLRQLFLDYEYLQDNIDFCEEVRSVSEPASSYTEELTTDKKRVLEIEQEIEKLISFQS